MTKRICNWCAHLATLDEGAPVWTKVELTIGGLNDGSIPWLPSRELHFCPEKDCQRQVKMVDDFFDGLPDHSTAGIQVVIAIDWGDRVVRRERWLNHKEAAEDARALARFFTGTSHPRNRPFLEGFYGAEEPS